MSEQRDRILALACEMYLEEGLEGFSMRRLARTLGVTPPALYRHFESKEKVLHAVVREAYQRLTRYLYAALQGRSPVDRFQLAGQAYLTFALENPRLFEVLWGAPDGFGGKSLPDDLEAQACAVGQFWIDRVRECMDEGVLRRGDPGETAVTLWAHAHGLLTLHLRGRLRRDDAGFRTLYRDSHRRLLAGLATPEYATRLLDEVGAHPVAEAAEDGSSNHIQRNLS